MTDGQVCAYLAPMEAERLLGAGHLLGAVRFGEENQPSGADSRRVTVGLPPLQSADLVEVWYADGQVAAGWDDWIGYACDGDTLFGHALVDEAGFSDLAEATRAAYRRIFDFLPGAGYPHLFRVWNFVERINDMAEGMERYQRFCTGRARAFDETGVGSAALPAASAVGTHASGLLICFLASKSAGEQVENRRQMSAFRYPPQYGPRSPRFSRAMLWRGGRREALYLSGTASIVGHRSVHPGQLERQLEETLRNIDGLLSQVARYAGASAEPLTMRALKVYVRNPNDTERVETKIRRWAGDDVPVILLRADVCRRELLLEVEGVLMSASRGAKVDKPDAGSGVAACG